jgi:hypothetical protein
MRPYKKPIFEEIKSNETAFLVPLEGATLKNQSKFMSEAYLDSAKISVKRIEIPQRWVQMGRIQNMGKWIPTMRVIRVDRSPVTREWTASSSTGTSEKDEALATSSRESIAFRVGITITASIMEEDAARFLYRFAGKSLADVLDQNVRGAVLARLSTDFGRLSVDQCRTGKSDIVNQIRVDMTKQFKKDGLTIEAMGTSGSLLFDDQLIQKRVNDVFIAEQNIKVQENDKLAQLQTNTKIRSIADTRLYEAQKFAAAQQATKDMVLLEIQKTRAQATLNFSEGLKEGKVQLPANIVPENSPFFFDLDARSQSQK